MPEASISTGVGANKTLIIEDDPTVGRLIERMLQGQSTVARVDSANEAVRLLATERFDVVVCDLQIPGMSGTALLSYARERLPEARRVLMTAGIPPDAAKVLCHAVLTKPFTRGALLEAAGMSSEG